jgi:hypothetical protein
MFRLNCLAVLLGLLLTQAAYAQKHALTIQVKDAAGIVIYEKSATMDGETMTLLLNAAEAAAASVGIKVPNPAHDPRDPSSQEQIAVTGPQAVTLLLKRYLSDIARAYAVQLAARQAAEAAKTTIDDKINKVEIK